MLLERCVVFMIAIGKVAIFLSEKFGFNKACFREGVCRVGVTLTYTLKYLELLEYRGYSYVVDFCYQRLKIGENILIQGFINNSGEIEIKNIILI